MMTKRLRWHMSLAMQKDIPAILELFKSVFGHEMSRELWQWKYGNGRGEGILVWSGDEIVAHYGGMSRRIMYFGKEKQACQIGDVMVKANERAIFTRKGPYFLAATSYLENFIGYGKKYLVGFGFPNTRAMRVAEKLGIYAKVDEMVQVTWSSLLRRPMLRTRVRPLDPSRDEDVVNLLWARMNRDLSDGIIGIRDWEHLKRRYLSRPGKAYELYLVSSRFSSNPDGVIILHFEETKVELMDMIAPLKNVSMLIDQARRLAGQRKFKQLICWITRHHSERFLKADGEEVSLNIDVPIGIWVPGPGVEEIRNRWWLMSGDTDFR